jgi:hypothetical protein
MEASRRQLWLRPGSRKDRRLAQLLAGRAVEREGSWWLDAPRPLDGVVSWPVPAPA